jgi:hypothetical protein
MNPAGAGLTDDSHGGVGPPPPDAKAAPPPASAPKPAMVTATAAPAASERNLPFICSPFLMDLCDRLPGYPEPDFCRPWSCFGQLRGGRNSAAPHDVLT